MISLLEENGWTLEDYAKETKKAQIREVVNFINANTQSNMFFDQMKVYFPDLVFHPARIDLGE